MRKSPELSEEMKAILAKLPELEQKKIMKRFTVKDRRKKDPRFYHPISPEEIDAKMISLENYYVKQIAKIVADQYILVGSKPKRIKDNIDLYAMIAVHINTKTKLHTSAKFIDAVISYMYENAGQLHIKKLLPPVTQLEDLFE